MSGRQGFAVPAPVGAREVARRHYDRLWLWPTLRVADPALQDGSGMASQESRRGAPVRRRCPECEPLELKRVTAGARLSAPDRTTRTALERAPAAPSALCPEGRLG